MGKPIFISIVHEDKADIIHTLKNWVKQNFIQNYDFILEEEDRRMEGEAGISKYLRDRLDKCQVVIFIIGGDTHSKEWIKWEYNYAQNKGKKLVFMHLKGFENRTVKFFPNVQSSKFNLNNFKKLV